MSHHNHIFASEEWFESKLSNDSNWVKSTRKHRLHCGTAVFSLPVEDRENVCRDEGSLVLGFNTSGDDPFHDISNAVETGERRGLF